MNAATGLVPDIAPEPELGKKAGHSQALPAKASINFVTSLILPALVPSIWNGMSGQKIGET